ncbi:DUF2188 domain-containing protein [Metabacillus sp. GX 13764]|uniref:DUF2188 domain-containing protein n=1 Tax=Metabacillus kandeliae TaxID=2900151 RepID=UPI001E623FF8|nr:DUF2188 domain-containing protein [Metabacillus kandeliae]MCD7035073.1 DUF2188 domain-containing protein [Metabacillus kandeliae]
MKEYSISPNKDASGWYVKLEDAAPVNLYSTKSEAIEAGEKLAEENKPSSLKILNDFHQVEEEKSFQ